MLAFKNISLTNFRCFTQQRFEFNNNINLIVGANGSGKSSVLEAIYLLSSGRSFRTNNLRSLYSRNNQGVLSIAAETQINSLPYFVDYNRDFSMGKKKLRLNNHAVSGISEVADMLPVCIIATDSFHALNADPEHRRKLIDWGVFHVEQRFLGSWKKYKKTLEQRNSLLRSCKVSRNINKNELLYWDQILAKYAVELILSRDKFFKEIEPLFRKYYSTMQQRFKRSSIKAKIAHGLGEFEYQGSSEQGLYKSIIDIFSKNTVKDIERGYTTLGPHRMDIKFSLNGGVAKYYLSRGQEKIVVLALYLAMLEVLNKSGKNPVILLDDIASELDEEYLSVFSRELISLNNSSQIIITGLDNCSFSFLDSNGVSVNRVELSEPK